MSETPPGSSQQSVGRSMISYAPSRFIEPALGLIAIPILTRTLGRAAFGDFTVVILTVTLARIVTFDWINNCALRFYRSMQADEKAYFSSIFAGVLLSLLLSAFLVGAVLNGIPNLLGDVFDGVLPWLFLAVVADGLARNIEMLLRAMGRPLAFSMVRGGLAVARHGVGLVFLLLASGSITAYLQGWAFASLLIVAWFWVHFRLKARISIRSASRKTMVRFLAFGFPVSLVLFANFMQVAGIRYVLKFFSGAEGTGLYSAAYSIAGMPVMLFQSVVMLGLYPLAIDSFERCGSFDEVVRSGLRYFLLVAAPLALLISLLAEPTLVVIAGEEYAEAWPVLTMISAGTFAYGLSQYFALRFLVEKETMRMAAINLTAGSCNIVFASLLVPHYGYWAAGATTILAYALVLAGALTWGVRPARTTIPWLTVLHVCLACIPIIVVRYLVSAFLRLPPFWECAGVCCVGSLSYLLVLWKSREISTEIGLLWGYVLRAAKWFKLADL